MNINNISQNAGVAMPEHDHYLTRLDNLQERIKANVANGKISEDQGKSFADTLKGIVDNLNSTREANGGYLTVQDRVQANKDMNALSRQIHSTAHPEE